MIIRKLSALTIQPTIMEAIKGGQLSDPQIEGFKQEVLEKKQSDFFISEDGVLGYKGGRICVPNDEEIKKQILYEAHNTPYAMHLGITKMYRDLKKHFWWSKMKRNVVEYVARCLTCQQVKAEHQRPGGMLQPLKIPEWKWEEVTIDFMSGLPKSSEGYNSIWVIVDRMTKSAHFLPVKTTDSVRKLAKLYLKEIVQLHGVLVSIVLNRDARITLMFWKELQAGFGIQLKFSIASHPQTDGQSE